METSKKTYESVEGIKIYKTRKYVQDEKTKQNCETRRLRDQYLRDHKEEILKLTEDEYVLYLTKLFFYDEMYLLETVIRENKGMYDISSPYHFEKVVETYLEKFNAIKNDLTLIDFDDLVKYQKESVHRKEFPSFFYSWLTYAKEKEDTVLMNIKTIEEYPKRTVPITIQYDNDEDKKRAEQNIEFFGINEDNFLKILLWISNRPFP